MVPRWWCSLGMGPRWWRGTKDLDPQLAGSKLESGTLCWCVCRAQGYPAGFGGDPGLGGPPLRWHVVFRLQVQTELVKVGTLGPQVAGRAVVSAAVGAVGYVQGCAGVVEEWALVSSGGCGASSSAPDGEKRFVERW